MSNYVTALYLRISSADENNLNEIEYSNSIVNQRDLLTSFIQKQSDLKDTEIIEICDDGWTGTSFDRPGMNHLLELVKSGKINCILVKDFSRFGRNYIEAGNYIEQVFPFLGVRFISVNDGYDSSKENISKSTFKVAFVNLIHDLYSKDLSDKVRTAQKTKWEKGKNISAHSIFGYAKSETEKHKLVIDENAAETVRKIFNMAAAGNNTRKIAITLNAHNIPTPNTHKSNSGCKRNWKQITNFNTYWTTSMIYRIITDERYTGKAIFGRNRAVAVGSKKFITVPESEWVVIENAFEAIISKDIFLQAQKVLQKCSVISKSKPKKRKKIICGGCNHVMQRYNYKIPVFVCRTPLYIDSPNCIKNQILESDIENIVFNAIRRHIDIFMDNDKKMRDKSSSAENNKRRIAEQIQGFKKELQKYTQKRMSLYDSYTDEKISREDYLIDRETLNSLITNIEKQIQALEIEFEQIPSYNEDPVAQVYLQFSQNTELTPEMIESLIESIIIYNDNQIEIKLKYVDEFYTNTII